MPSEVATDTVVRIRDIAGVPGTKQRGLITVGETPMGPIQFPLVIITGVKAGPRLCITAGVHGTEYPAMDSLMRTIAQLNPNELAGTVIAVPVVNSMMFRTRAPYLSPIDGLNLNRTFPGIPDGTISEVLAHVVLNEIVLQADYHIDCHGGDLPEVLLPYTGYPTQGKMEQDAIGEAMARLYSPRIVALYREGTTLPSTKGSLVSEASKRGVPSILTESGSAGGLDSAHVQIHMNGARNVMRFFKMIPGEPVLEGERLAAKDQFLVTARKGGLVRLAIGIGEELKRDQLIAEICDVFGDVVEQVRSPRDGIARILWTNKAVNTGDPIVKCWIADQAPPFELPSR